MSLTPLLVPTYTNMLQALSAWLDKAKAQRGDEEAEALLSARLAPDMFPLSSQVRFACFQAQEATFLLRGQPVPEALVRMALDGRTPDAQPESLTDAKARISDALSFLAGLGADALDDGADRPITLDFPDGMIFDMTGEQYARDWALPQFYFHIMTAYAILRSQGIDLGKADYVPHMGAYLRAGRGE